MFSNISSNNSIKTKEACVSPAKIFKRRRSMIGEAKSLMI
jgi:hypothetical protein